MMCWCDICMGDGKKSHGSFWRIEINKYHSLDEQYSVPIWVLSICSKWAHKLGLFFVATNFHCYAFYCDNVNGSYHCSIIEELAKKVNADSTFFGPGDDGVLRPAKPNCEACVRTRLRQYLGIRDYSWFNDWIREESELGIVKYANDLKVAEEIERIAQSGS